MRQIARFTVMNMVAVAMSATLQASVTLTSLTGSPNVPGTATFAVNADRLHATMLLVK